MYFCLLAQFAYRKAQACTDALLTISHHLQKSLDTGMESYIVQLDFSAAFERVSYSGLLLKLKSIGVGGSVLSICRQSRAWLMVLLVIRSQSFLACHRQVCWVSSVHPLYKWNVWVVENRLYDYTDDSTLLAVVRKTVDRPSVAACLS